ncbi:glycine zipper domain-containing protein [Burkholderia cepacia]|uniref:glycine zipper domain-containing protein n=1 Tax=Burkholderia cepacia TaxID=292 RepID=UPI0007C77B6D|nr:DUF883 family protein [Burkholderia cepacia]
MSTLTSLQGAAEQDAKETEHERVGAYASDEETARDAIRDRLKHIKSKAADAQVIVVEKGKKTARVANEYVHDRPWTTALTALGVGVLVGLLIGRR